MRKIIIGGGLTGLSSRREAILKIVVDEYIASATPVASEGIAYSYSLGVSPATIRNEMTQLEKEEYITRPYVSAGGVPSDKGYRYYVEHLIGEAELPEAEQDAIRQLFHPLEQELEEWMHLTAAVLAQRLKSIALVTSLQAAECHLKHLDLVALHEFLALLILVLRGAKLKRQLLSLEQGLSQDELTAIANRLNATYEGLTCSQIEAQKIELAPIEEQITETIVRIMEAEDRQFYKEFYLDGLRHLLNQPEFAKRKEKMLDLIQMFEEKSALIAILSSLRNEAGIQIIIGSENKEEALQEYSLILSQYGGEMKGAIGVIGPKRMPYDRAIATTLCLSSVMTDLVSQIHL
jgi:heat-inducible transcriptional repressor